MSNVQGDQKTSHITHRSKRQAYAESQDWTVVGTFEDLDLSAIKLSSWERPDLRAWLADKANEWDALMSVKTDRVFGSAADRVKLAAPARKKNESRAGTTRVGKLAPAFGCRKVRGWSSSA